MDESLRCVLLGLATDPQEMNRYLMDRKSYLTLAGLSPEACKALLDGDQEKVADLVGAGPGNHTQMNEQNSHKKNNGKKGKKGEKGAKKASKKTTKRTTKKTRR
jgi:hypothetical protein